MIEGGLGADDAADTSFLGSTLKEAMATPPTPGALEIIPRLVALFDGKVWIISKCGEYTQRKTMAWLDHHDFYGRTGVPHDNVRFCRERADKAVHCREVGVTHMIDDRLEVHSAIRHIVPNLFLFGPQDGEIPDWVVHVADWPAVAAQLLSSTSC